MRDTSRNQEFVDLLTVHQSRVFSYLMALLRDMTDADDVFQQTSLVLWKKFDDYEPDTDFVRWALSVAQLEAANFLRSKRRRQAIFSDAFQDHLAQLHAEQDDDLLEARRQALALCVEKVDDDDRELLDRCYGTPMTMKQVAAQLACRPNVIYDRISRIRRKLLRCIQGVLERENNR